MYKKLLLSSISILTIQTAIGQITNPSPYCDAKFDDAQGFWVDDHISRVQFGSLDNQTNGQYAAPHYVFYNNLNVEKFTVGNAYQLKATFEVKGGCGYGIWIDYNKNNVFEDSEKIAGTTGTTILDIGSNISITKNITIPANATPGKTRMRVRLVEDDLFIMNSSDLKPCNLSTSNEDVMDWGETEDYEIEIISNAPTAIKDQVSKVSFNIFPNPSTKTINIESSKGIDAVTIFNGLGQTLYNSTYNSKHSVHIDHNFSTGMYMIAIKNGSDISYQKVNVVQP